MTLVQSLIESNVDYVSAVPTKTAGRSFFSGCPNCGDHHTTGFVLPAVLPEFQCLACKTMYSGYEGVTLDKLTFRVTT